MAQRKYTQKKLIKIENDDVNMRDTIKATLLQAQEALNLKENEIASKDLFDETIKSYETLLSTLRTITEEVGAATASKEHFIKIARVDENIIDRIVEFNVKLLAIANDICSQAKTDSDIMVIKKNTDELRNTFAERQKLFLVEKIH